MPGWINFNTIRTLCFKFTTYTENDEIDLGQLFGVLLSGKKKVTIHPRAIDFGLH